MTGVAGVVGRMLRERLSHVYRLSGADRVRLREPGFDRIDLRMDIAHRGGHHLVPSSGGCHGSSPVNATSARVAAEPS